MDIENGCQAILKVFAGHFWPMGTALAYPGACRATVYEKFTEIPLYPGAISLGQHNLLGVKKAKAMADRNPPQKYLFCSVASKESEDENESTQS